MKEYSRLYEQNHATAYAGSDTIAELRPVSTGSLITADENVQEVWGAQLGGLNPPYWSAEPGSAARQDVVGRDEKEMGDDRPIPGELPPTDIPPINGDRLQGDDDDRFLSFRQPFDGTQPELSLDEKQAAGTHFSQEVGVIVRFMGRQSDDGACAARYRMNRGGRTIGVTVVDMSNRDPNERAYVKRILLRHVIDDEATGDAAEYRLGEDGVVRRVDQRGMGEERRRAYKAYLEDRLRQPQDVSFEDLISQAHAFRKQLREATELAAFEDQLGMRNQPVSVEEVTALFKFIRGF